MVVRLVTGLAFLLACAGVVVAADAPAAPAAPAAAPPAPAAPAAQVPGTDAQFFGELAYKDIATAADTARAIAILVSEGTESGADFETAKAYLKGRGVLPDGWLDKAGPDTPTTKGRLASLICRALGIKGGLWMRLFGPVPRLAVNECIYLELMTAGADYGHMTGGELAGVIDRADRLRAKGTAKEVPELEGEPSGAVEVKK